MKPETFPSVRQAAALLLALFLLEYLINVALYDARQALGLDSSQQGALARLLADGVAFVAVMQFRGTTYRELIHPSKTSPLLTLLIIVPPVLLLVPAIYLVDGVTDTLLEKLLPLSRWEEMAFEGMNSGTLASLLSTCVLAPILEEMLFRGVLLRSFLSQHERWAAISYSALFFGAAHMNIYQFVLAFWLGLLFGWLFERTRSLIPCMCLHAAVNASVFFTESDMQNASGNDALEQSMWVWFAALLCALAGSYFLRRLLVSNSAAASNNAS